MIKRLIWSAVALAAIVLIALAGVGRGVAAETTYANCRVSRVVDGDTFVCRYPKPNGKYATITVRVRVIDTPEASRWYSKRLGSMQPAECWGKEASSAAYGRLRSETVTIVSYGLDSHGRHLADVYMADGTRFEHWMLAEGHAAIYKGYKTYLSPEDGISRAAKSAGKGMWGSCPNPPGHNGRQPMPSVES
jgi:endonuclease YncB( thermonuclease family)